MGRFFTKDDIPDRNKFPYGNPHNWDWHVGSIKKNFSYQFAWYEKDDITKDRETRHINKIEIRRWCERELNGDVYVSSDSKTEIVYFNPEKKWEGNYEVSACWTNFYFELESDLLAFKLMWA